eukprot:Sspe_Gene.36897::Locus_17825_Transcript_1_1_Confidence_1.000_Length_4582::g.36897::m.36897
MSGKCSGRRDMCVLMQDERIRTDDTVDCCAVGKSIFAAGLASGKVQVVAGPLRQTLYRFSCMHSRLHEIQLLEDREALLTIESNETSARVAVLYTFQSPMYRGALSAQVLPIHGSVAKVAVCSVTSLIAVATKSIITVLAFPDDGSSLVAPYIEVRTPLELTTVSICGDCVSYGSSEEMWCVSFTTPPPSQLPHPSDVNPLASGVDQPLFDPSFVEVSFKTAKTDDAHFTRLPKDGVVEQPGVDIGMEYVHIDGSVNSITRWSQSKLHMVSGPLPLVEHSAYFVGESLARPPPVFHVHLKRRLDPTSDGELIEARLLPSQPAYTSGIRTVNTTPVKVLIVSAKKAWLYDISGKKVCDYAFDSGCKMVAISSMFLFVVTHQGSLEVYPMRCQHIVQPPTDIPSYFKGGQNIGLPVDTREERAPSSAGRQSHLGQSAAAAGSGTRRTAFQDLRERSSSNAAPKWFHRDPLPVTAPLLQTRNFTSPVKAVSCSEDMVVVVSGKAGDDPFDPTDDWGRNGSDRSPPYQHLVVGYGMWPQHDGCRVRTASGSSSSSARRNTTPRAGPLPNFFACCVGIRVATPAEILQGVVKDVRRCNFSSDESGAISLLHEGLQLLSCYVSALELQTSSSSVADVASLSAQLELANAKALQAAAATIIADTHFRLEHGPVSSGRLKNVLPRIHRPEGGSRIDAVSNRSNSTFDATSDPSVYSSTSHGEGVSWEAAERVAFENDKGTSRSRALPAPADDPSRGSWLFYVHSDRTIKQVCTLLKTDILQLMAYLDVVLFSPHKLKVLYSGSETSQPVVSEDLGNAILLLYAKFAPHRLCSVVWNSWLSRSKSGAVCFTAGKAARLLKDACRRCYGARTSHRLSEGLVTSASMPYTHRSYEDSELEDADSRYDGTTSWASGSPRDYFVMGLLHLEDNNVTACVEAWSAIDPSALIELSTASRHLWHSDVLPGDQADDATLGLAPMPFMKTTLEDPPVKDPSSPPPPPSHLEECIVRLYHAVAKKDDTHPVSASGSSTGNVAEEAVTMGTVLALHFPWVVVAVLVELRTKYGFPVTSALRILQRAVLKQGMLTAQFLLAALAVTPPSSSAAHSSPTTPAALDERNSGPKTARSERRLGKTREAPYLHTYVVCFLLCEMKNHLVEHRTRDRFADLAMCDVFGEEILGSPIEDLDRVGSIEMAGGKGLSLALVGSTTGLGSDVGNTDSSALDDASKTGCRPPTIEVFNEMAVAGCPTDTAPYLTFAHSRPSWMAALDAACLGLQGTPSPSDLLVQVLTKTDHSVASITFLLLSLEGVLWAMPQVAASVTETLIASAEEHVRTRDNTPHEDGTQRFDDGLISIAVLLMLKQEQHAPAILMLRPVLPFHDLLPFCFQHCGKDTEKWRPLVAALTDARENEALISTLNYLVALLPLRDFLLLLPKNGNTRFFLPIIQRAMALHHSRKLQEKVVSVLSPDDPS